MRGAPLGLAGRTLGLPGPTPGLAGAPKYPLSALCICGHRKDCGTRCGVGVAHKPASPFDLISGPEARLFGAVYNNLGKACKRLHSGNDNVFRAGESPKPARRVCHL